MLYFLNDGLVIWPAVDILFTLCKGKGKVGRAPPERRRGAHLPFKAIEPVGG